MITFLSYTLLQQGIAKCQTPRFGNRHLLKTMAFIVILSAPTIFFTPIGSLPTLACITSLAALPFVAKKKLQTVLTPITDKASAIPA